MRNFYELKVWEKAHQLTLELYGGTNSFPVEERYGLRTQIRRAAASIGANIAEGCGKTTDADFGRYLQIALGSATELEYHLVLARDLGFMKGNDLISQTKAVKRMLTRFIQALNQRESQS